MDGRDSQPHFWLFLTLLPHRHLKTKTCLIYLCRHCKHVINVEWLRETLKENSHLIPWLFSYCVFIWACLKLWFLNPFRKLLIKKNKQKKKIKLTQKVGLELSLVFFTLLHVRDLKKTVSNCLMLFINFIIVYVSGTVSSKNKTKSVTCFVKWKVNQNASFQ